MCRNRKTQNKIYDLINTNRNWLIADIYSHDYAFWMWRSQKKRRCGDHEPEKPIQQDKKHKTNSELRFLEILINDLAEQWDNRINNIRKETGVDPLLESKHRFSIKMEKNIKQTPVLKKTNLIMPPDKRYGEISYSKKGSKCMKVMSILHEMGHSIGKRERQYRFLDIFLPMLAERTIYEISARYCQLITDNKERCEKLSNQMTEEDREKVFAHEKEIEGIYSILPDLQTQLEKIYDVFSKQLIAQYKEDLDEPNIAFRMIEVLCRQITSIDMRFFVCCRGILLLILSFILNTDETDKDAAGENAIIGNATDDFFYGDLVKAISRSSQLPEEDIRDRLKPCLDDMRNECLNYCLNKYADDAPAPPVWYRDAEEVLEETVADIFMLRICYIQPSSRQYCNLLIDGIQENKDKDKQSLTELIAMPSNLLRVLGVCHAIENHTGHHWRNLRHRSGKYQKLGYRENSKIYRALQKCVWGQKFDAYDYIKNKYSHIEGYITEDNSIPVLLRKESLSFSYSPKVITQYLDYVDMIWRKYDQVFMKYENNEPFMRPVKQIRREVKWLKRNRRKEYLKKTLEDQSKKVSLFICSWNNWNKEDNTDAFKLVNGVVTLDVPQCDYMAGRIVNLGDWGSDKGFQHVTEGRNLIRELGTNIGDNNIEFINPGRYTISWDGAAVSIIKRELLFVGDWNNWDYKDEADTYCMKDNTVTLDIPQKGMSGRIVYQNEREKDRGFQQVSEGRELIRRGSILGNNIAFRSPGRYTISWDGSAISIKKRKLIFVGAWNEWNNLDEENTYCLKDGIVTLDVPRSEYMGGRIVYQNEWGTDKGFQQVSEGRELIKDLGENIGDNNIVFLNPGRYTIFWDGSAISIKKKELLFVGTWNKWNNKDKTDAYCLKNGVVTLDIQRKGMSGRIVYQDEWGKDKGFQQVAEGKELIRHSHVRDNNIAFLYPGRYIITWDGSAISIKKRELIFVGAWNEWNNKAGDIYCLKDGSVTLDVQQKGMSGRIVYQDEWGTDKGFQQVIEGKELIRDLGEDVGDNNIEFLNRGRYTVSWDGTSISIKKRELLFVGTWNRWNSKDKTDTYRLKEGSLTLDIPRSGMSGRIVYQNEMGTDKGFLQVAKGKDLIKDLGVNLGDNNIEFINPGRYTISWHGAAIAIKKEKEISEKTKRKNIQCFIDTIKKKGSFSHITKEKVPRKPEANDNRIEHDNLNKNDIMEQIPNPDGQEDE